MPELKEDSSLITLPGKALQQKPPGGLRDLAVAAASSGVTAGAMHFLNPSLFREWIDLVGAAGMPGILVFVLFYLWFRERRIWFLEAKVEELYDRRIEDRDQVATKNEAMAERRAEAQEKLAESLDGLRGEIRELRKVGTRNGA